MKIGSRLDQFMSDNPYDATTQAKRLFASKDEKLILHVLQLGFSLARQRQRHDDREYIKTTGYVQPEGKLVMTKGRVTGSVIIRPIKKTNVTIKLIVDHWLINGEQRVGDAGDLELAAAIKREGLSVDGHEKNKELYRRLRAPLIGNRKKVRDVWTEDAIRTEIEAVYGEFRKSEAA